MKSPKKSKKKSSGSSGGGGAQQFLVEHGEKIVVGIVVVVALWFAMQGLGRQSLSWKPEELEEAASAAEKGIRESTRNVEDEEIKIVDYVAFAEQIKSPILPTPYRTRYWDRSKDWSRAPDSAPAPPTTPATDPTSEQQSPDPPPETDP